MMIPKVMQLVRGEGRLTPGLLNSDVVVSPSYLRQLSLERYDDEKREGRCFTHFRLLLSLISHWSMPIISLVP